MRISQEHGVELVRAVRKAGKFKKIYRELFPETATRLDRLYDVRKVSPAPPAQSTYPVFWYDVWGRPYQPMIYNAHMIQPTGSGVSDARSRSASNVPGGLRTCGMRGQSTERHATQSSTSQCHSPFDVINTSPSRNRHQSPPPGWFGDCTAAQPSDPKRASSSEPPTSWIGACPSGEPSATKRASSAK